MCEREIKNEEGKQKSFPSDVKWIRKDLYQIVTQREIKNEEDKQKSFPSDVKWIRKDLYQIFTHLTSRLHTHPPTNVNLTFVVAI